MNITLRPAGDEDRAFAYAVKKAALRPYVEQVWGWDEAVQRAFQARDWEACRPEILVVDDTPVGTIVIDRRADRDADPKHIRLGEFYILPEWQGRGIGTTLLTRLAEEADAAGVPLRLEVIQINPARRLYLRMGFRVIGETETHYRMERQAASNRHLKPR